MRSSNLAETPFYTSAENTGNCISLDAFAKRHILLSYISWTRGERHMAWSHQDECAIVGVGATDYYVRGKSWPRTINDMAAEAIMNACADAGISHKQSDGFAYYSTAGAGYPDKCDTASLMEPLGMPHHIFYARLPSGGGDWKNSVEGR